MAATRTVEEVLREGGFTRFHRRVVLITGFAWTFVAFEIILISFVLPAVFATFDRSGAQPVLYSSPPPRSWVVHQEPSSAA
jgi:hypothetical protein